MLDIHAMLEDLLQAGNPHTFFFSNQPSFYKLLMHIFTFELDNHLIQHCMKYYTVWRLKIPLFYANVKKMKMVTNCLYYF